MAAPCGSLLVDGLVWEDEVQALSRDHAVVLLQLADRHTAVGTVHALNVRRASGLHKRLKSNVASIALQATRHVSSVGGKTYKGGLSRHTRVSCLYS